VTGTAVYYAPNSGFVGKDAARWYVKFRKSTVLVEAQIEVTPGP
jgi:hypothetical protein